MLSSLNGIEYSLLIQLHNAVSNRFLDAAMPYVSDLGNLGAVWIIFSVILLTNRKYRNIGIMCLAALLLTTVIGEGLLKNIIQRPRPFAQFASIQPLIPEPSSFSFPSGHTGSSFAAATVIARNLKKAAVPALALAAAVAFSRLYLMVHYPTDILGGIILGVACAICAEILVKKYFSRKEIKQI
ncbi:MAG TPA: phosphatase PAP2 family protein [Clostridiaceae bacterium]|nr:phosphatase PAP2 family protein [Clostridiaceae bacterium]